MSSIYSRPGATFYSEINNAPSGLTGTMGVRVLRKADGAEVVARRTTGITEQPAESGHYVARLIAPAEATAYTVLWDSGEVSPSTTGVDDLEVSASGAAQVPTSEGPNFTSVPAVRRFLQKQDGDTGQDAVIEELIQSATAAIIRYTGRQFAPEDGVTKTFTWHRTSFPNWLDLSPFEVRSVESVTVDPEAASPTTFAATDYRLWPQPSQDGTYSAIELNPLAVGPTLSSWNTLRSVAVSGNWGMEEVPDDIEHWCKVTVAIWLRRDVAAFETGMNVDEGYVERPRSLPSAVASGLDLYRRVSA